MRMVATSALSATKRESRLGALLHSTTMVAAPLMAMNAKECAMVVTSCVAKTALAQRTTKKVAKNGLMRMVATTALSATKRESRVQRRTEKEKEKEKEKMKEKEKEKEKEKKMDKEKEKRQPRKLQ